MALSVNTSPPLNSGGLWRSATTHRAAPTEGLSRKQCARARLAFDHAVQRAKHALHELLLAAWAGFGEGLFGVQRQRVAQRADRLVVVEVDRRRVARCARPSGPRCASARAAAAAAGPGRRRRRSAAAARAAARSSPPATATGPVIADRSSSRVMRGTRYWPSLTASGSPGYSMQSPMKSDRIVSTT